MPVQQRTQVSAMTAVWGKNSPEHGEAPAIVLINPKYGANVAKAIRLASCYGLKQVWWTGNRVTLDQKRRLPREERMKGYKDVSMIQYDRPFDQFPADVTPVAIEVRDNSESLFAFEHPKNAIYVFGPEDGSIDRVLLGHCHRFVVIPTRHCLNLATAVATVLWDRQFKLMQQGLWVPTTPGHYEQRGIASEPEMDSLDALL